MAVLNSSRGASPQYTVARGAFRKKQRLLYGIVPQVEGLSEEQTSLQTLNVLQVAVHSEQVRAMNSD